MTTADSRKTAPCLQAILATVASAAIVLLVLAALNWVWVLTHEPEPGQGRVSYFLHSLLTSSIMIGVQFVVLLAAAIVIAIVRGRYRKVAGVFAGLLLVVIDILAAGAGFLPDTTVRYIIYCFGFPVLVSLFQWWPSRPDTEA